MIFGLTVKLELFWPNLTNPPSTSPIRPSRTTQPPLVSATLTQARGPPPLPRSALLEGLDQILALVIVFLSMEKCINNTTTGTHSSRWIVDLTTRISSRSSTACRWCYGFCGHFGWWCSVIFGGLMGGSVVVVSNDFCANQGPKNIFDIIV